MSALARFEREADVVAGLSHPHVVKVHDRGEADGRLWIAYDYIRGDDLAELSRTAPPSAEQVARWTAEIAGALDAAAARGLVHRDVKPANILIDDQGRALLTGTPPFTGGSATAIMLGHAQERVPAASARRAGLPPSVDQVFFRGLAKNPADRFPTSTSFAAALSQALAPSPSAALHPPAPPPQAQTPSHWSGEPPRPAGDQNRPPNVETDPAAPTRYHAAYDPTQVRTGEPPATGRNRKGLLIGAGVVAAVIALVIALVVVLPGDDGPTGTGAADDPLASTPSLAPEAAGLERRPVSPNLVSLQAAPGAPKWDWKPPHDRHVDELKLLGGTSGAVVIGELASSFGTTGGSRVTLYVVDAESGDTRHTVKVPIDDYVSLGACDAFGESETVLCEVDSHASGDEEKQFVTLDLTTGRASRIFEADSSNWAITADSAVFASTSGVTAFDRAGRRLWTAPNAYPASLDPANMLTGSPVVEVRNGADFTLRAVSDGRIVYRKNLSKTLDNGPEGAVPWAPFLGGFAVHEGGQTVFYDAGGRRTSALREWSPIGYDRMYAQTAQTVTPLPIVSRGNDLGAVDPVTGTLLWQRPIGAEHRNDLIGGFGTHAVVEVEPIGGGGRVAYLIDPFTGTGTQATGVDKSLALGTDGTRLALTVAGGETLFAFGGGARLWQLSAAADNAASNARFAAVGDKIYQGTRRVL